MNKQSLRQRLGARFYAASGAIASTAMVAAPAFAGGGGGGVDTSSILSVFEENKVAAIAIAIAFAVVLWAIRGAGLLKPKG